MSNIMNTYGRLPVAFERGDGVWVWDTAGKRYLDALAGIAVNGLGHAHPKFVAALTEQIGRLIHTSNLYAVPLQEELATKIATLSGMDRVFFCNSGCEANEAAIKLARLFGHRKGVEIPTIVVAEKSFHGRTMATLSATGNRKVQIGFEPLVAGFLRVPFDDIESIRQIAAHDSNVVAVLLEPVQGEGGINVARANYLKDLRRLCDEQGWLLMLDEVQTGIGRTGKWFGFQHCDILPDVMTLAKGLGSGVPVGACVARGVAAEVFQPGNHGSTFGGNPLACRAALATFQIMEEDGLLLRASELGESIREGFRREIAALPGVKEIRGQGLMIGIELDRPCGDLVKRALAHGLLINVTADTVIRLLPPLVIGRDEADQLVVELSALVRQFLSEAAA